MIILSLKKMIKRYSIKNPLSLELSQVIKGFLLAGMIRI